MLSQSQALGWDPPPHQGTPSPLTWWSHRTLHPRNAGWSPSSCVSLGAGGAGGAPRAGFPCSQAAPSGEHPGDPPPPMPSPHHHAPAQPPAATLVRVGRASGFFWGGGGAPQGQQPHAAAPNQKRLGGGVGGSKPFQPSPELARSPRVAQCHHHPLGTAGVGVGPPHSPFLQGKGLQEGVPPGACVCVPPPQILTPPRRFAGRGIACLPYRHLRGSRGQPGTPRAARSPAPCPGCCLWVLGRWGVQPPTTGPPGNEMGELGAAEGGTIR